MQPRLGRLTFDKIRSKRRLLFGGKSQPQIAQNSGLSRQRASQMYQRVMAAVN
ncbi:TrfB-related DNA-binding protein [Pseudomonas quasicaspiana]|uniref:TrfB-related DNA-binding protein n=1 Tax=Pseudomonas quasicaspiana TaxID=2829821 RepID=UPI003872E611|nr:hypothetical protein [Pseudomonas quasicaspiana]